MTKNKEYCIHLIDNQGNTFLEIEDIHAKTAKSAIKEAKDSFFSNYGLEINRVCSCGTDNYYKETHCDNCGKKL